MFGQKGRIAYSRVGAEWFSILEYCQLFSAGIARLSETFEKFMNFKIRNLLFIVVTHVGRHLCHTVCVTF
jgi:hypothetical protein